MQPQSDRAARLYIISRHYAAALARLKAKHERGQLTAMQFHEQYAALYQSYAVTGSGVI